MRAAVKPTENEEQARGGDRRVAELPARWASFANATKQPLGERRIHNDHLSVIKTGGARERERERRTG